MDRSDIRQLFDYMEWANALAYGAAAKLSEEQLQRDVQICHKSILGTLQHLAFAEWIWVERWQGRSPVGPDVWPSWKTGCTTMDLLHERWQDVLPRRSEFIAELSEDRLRQNLEFKLVDGSAGSLALIGTMQNVVNHATMHRGQIVGMIRQLGITPPRTDLLYYLRQKTPWGLLNNNLHKSVQARYTPGVQARSQRGRLMADADTTHVRATVARAAEWRDADQLSQTLARAFFDDPLICFLLGERTAMMPRLFRALFRLALPYGACDVTEGYEAAALWRPPGRWHTPFYRYVINGPQLQLLRVFGLAGLVRAVSTMNHIEKQHPNEPHYYLQAIGTDPQKQGKGFGGVVMRRHLAVADGAGMPSYLESSKEGNIPMYQSFGFQVMGEIKLPEGPTLYPMWRPARAQP